MKKVFATLLLLFIVLGCTGCNRSHRYTPQENINVNYNNISASGMGLCMTDDTLCCSETIGYYTTMYAYTADDRKQLSSGFTYPDIVQVLDDTAYLLDEVDKAIYTFSTYDLNTGIKTKQTTLYNVGKSFVVEERLYFMPEYGIDEEGFYYSEIECRPLYVYSLEDGTTTQIAESVFAAGVMGDIPVYLIENDNNFQLYTYNSANNESTLIETIPYTLSADYYIEKNVNFTSDKVVLYASDLECESTVLLRYDCTSDQVSEYYIDGWVSSFVAFEDYGFVVVTDTSNSDGHTDDYDSTISRICLQDGTMETIAELKGWPDIYVTSDECVYGTYSDDVDGLYRFDLDGTETLVYRWRKMYIDIDWSALFE